VITTLSLLYGDAKRRIAMTEYKGGKWIILWCLFLICSCSPSREQNYDISLFIYVSEGFSEGDVLSGKIVPLLIEPELDIRFVGRRPLGYLREIGDDRISISGVSFNVNRNSEKNVQILNSSRLYDIKISLTESPLRADVVMRMLTDVGGDQVLFDVVDYPMLFDEYIAIYAPPWVDVHEEHITVFLRISKVATEWGYQ
jgi:hypothetical protein